MFSSYKFLGRQKASTVWEWVKEIVDDARRTMDTSPP